MKKILLLPIGDVEPVLLGHIGDALESSFRIGYELAKTVPVPEDSYNPARAQYNSTVILGRLADSVPRGFHRVLGVTEEDLFAPRLNFVFGEADLLSGVAVISLCRLRQEFYGLYPDEALLRARAAKEAVHEIGHTLGLGHCKDPKCVMHFSNSLRDTDIKGREFCEICRKKAGFNKPLP